ncbi:hypothetical protein KAJ27_14360, partial [bacterium]|nr:hypothetical protein [bacterium]
DQRGQLIVSAHLLHFNQVFLGLYGKASALLTRAEKLYNQISTTLSIYERVLLAKIIALGFIVLRTDPIAARPFYCIAMDLSEQHNMAPCLTKGTFG